MFKPGRIALVTGVLVAGLVGGFLGERLRLGEAVAQEKAEKAPAEPPSFQISSFGYANATGTHHGAFIVDTRSGRVWVVDKDGMVVRRGQTRDP